MLGTGLFAHSAANADTAVNSCNAVLNVNSLYGTDGNAVAVSETSVIALAGASEKKRRRMTGMFTVENCLL